jgi:hypothetical protein
MRHVLLNDILNRLTALENNLTNHTTIINQHLERIAALEEREKFHIWTWHDDRLDALEEREKFHLEEQTAYDHVLVKRITALENTLAPSSGHKEPAEPSLVEMLRKRSDTTEESPVWGLDDAEEMEEAADKIEELEAEIARLRALLFQLETHGPD